MAFVLFSESEWRGQKHYRFFFLCLSLVTDYERKFVLGVATPQDLEVNFFSSELLATDPILFRCSHSSRDAAYRPQCDLDFMTFFLASCSLAKFTVGAIRYIDSCQHRTFPS